MNQNKIIKNYLLAKRFLDNHPEETNNLTFEKLELILRDSKETKKNFFCKKILCCDEFVDLTVEDKVEIKISFAEEQQFSKEKFSASSALARLLLASQLLKEYETIENNEPR